MMKVTLEFDDVATMEAVTLLYRVLGTPYNDTDALGMEDGDSIMGVYYWLSDALFDGVELQGTFEGEHHYTIYGAEVTDEENIVRLDDFWKRKRAVERRANYDR